MFQQLRKISSNLIRNAEENDDIIEVAVSKLERTISKEEILITTILIKFIW